MPNYIVRYGAMRILGAFPPCGDQQYERGENVVVRTDRGLEDGRSAVRGHTRSLGIAEKPVSGTDLSQDDRGGLA